MARRASNKPWHHEKSGYWCSTVQGKRVYLDKDYKVACRKLKQMLTDIKRAEQGAALDWLDASIGSLCDEFLDHIQALKKATTHEGYRQRLLRGLKIIGPKTRVADIGKLHLAMIEREMANRYSPTTVKDTIAVLQTVFNWAQKHDLIFDNPLTGYEKPAGRVRTRTVTDEEFQLMLKHSDQSFSDVLIALRHTGCRPVEIRTLVWDWVDLDQRLWILKDHKTITRQRNPLPRIIPLGPEVHRLCEKLSRKKHGAQDHVFLNARGTPYTKDALCTKMRRLRNRAGICSKAGEAHGTLLQSTYVWFPSIRACFRY